ncbi:MAG: beta galactosidase jelly roll domain-containing protein [Planctomycetota bacterium]|jgi:beta-galactosidase|nr:beta galactosidase jelly roll domain-containing protein [Planctomycetota bacterium]
MFRCALIAMLLLCSQLTAQELFTNGDFETIDNDWPVGVAPHHKLASLHQEQGNHFLRIDRKSEFTRDIALKPSWLRLRLQLRMRLQAVGGGTEAWHDARLVMSWHDASGTRVGAWPSVIHGAGTSTWKEHSKDYDIPDGATSLRLGPALFAPNGQADFDDISLTVIDKRAALEDSPRPAAAPDTDDLSTAWTATSAKRHSVCLNGLWRFLPVLGSATTSPPASGSGWTWFKVPGVWPRTYRSWEPNENASLTVPNAGLEQRVDWATIQQAWYTRHLICPPRAAGQRSLLRFAMVQTHAAIFVDGVRVGEQLWPGGSVDLTDHLIPGHSHELALLVSAKPLDLESTIEMGPGRSFATKGTVKLRGITGDVFIDTVGSAAQLTRLQFEPNTTNKTVTIRSAVTAPGTWDIGLRIDDDASTLPAQRAQPGPDGRLAVSLPWPEVQQWDLEHPHLYTVRVQLFANGQLIDESLPTRIGFRDFRIKGRDFILNGSRVALRALLSHNITGQADLASIDGCRRSIRAAKAMGFNAFITHNYNFRPGTVSEMDAFYRAADEEGMLIACSLPHAGTFAWKLDDPVVRARYTSTTEWIIDRVGHHPAIVLYTMNHNSTGFRGDQNPLILDGSFLPERDAPAAGNWRNRSVASQAEEIAKAIDPSRPVYHHQSGPLGDVYSLNCYLNWAPIQERCDWLERWAQSQSSKPLFFVEWGLPHIASWSSYRGPAFIWRTEAPQAIWDSEFAAPIIGPSAYRYDDAKRKQVAHEEMFYREGKPIPFGYLVQPLRGAHTYTSVQAAFTARTWPALRMHGISAILPWDQENLWRPTGDAEGSIDNPDRWRGLQQPGMVPDRLHRHDQAISTYTPAAFTRSQLGETLTRWNQPVIAFLAGDPAHPTEAGHCFTPGETITKSVRLINDSRHAVTATYRWQLGERTGTGTLSAAIGAQAAAPIIQTAPSTPGQYELGLSVTIADHTEHDTHVIDVLAPRPAPQTQQAIAVYDPIGDTMAWLQKDGIAVTEVTANDDLSTYASLIIGRAALTTTGPVPGFNQLERGLQILIAPQHSTVLAHRFGFRVTEQGLRRLFIREAGHPLLAGITDAHLHNWRGQASLLPPYLEGATTDNPHWQWSGFDNTRVWRAGTWGTVCQVAIEEPSTGPYRSLLDGGFDLQYTALLEHRVGAGRVVLCQLELGSRGVDEPAAVQLRRNLLAGITTPLRAETTRTLYYDGNETQASLLRELGATARPYTGQKLDSTAVLALGPEAQHQPQLSTGATVIALGLNETELQALLPTATVTTMPRLPDLITLPNHPALRGISPAELHWRSEVSVADTTGPGSPALRLHQSQGATVLVIPAPPSVFEAIQHPYVRTTIRRSSALVCQLLRNQGIALSSPLVAHAQNAPPPHRIDLTSDWRGQVDRNDDGQDQHWFAPEFNASGWQPVRVPGCFDLQIPELADYDGLFWYRLEFATPAELPSGALELVLGAIDDESWVWLNGEFLGATTKTSNPNDYWAAQRRFPLTPAMLRSTGEPNVLVVRVNDTYKNGGIIGSPHIAGQPRWLQSSYRQVPRADDDPYRYYRW